jgi:pantetheine-phosphate adenylyltransferase
VLAKYKNQDARNNLQRIAVYPGTFDPITKGHLDIITRASKLVDKLVVGVAFDVIKPTLFSFDERVQMAKLEALRRDNVDGNKIEVVGFKGLLIEFVKSCKSNLIVRGLRAVSDFEYEFQLFSSNYRLDRDVETVFLPAKDDTHFISATMVKEIARLKGDVSSFVPEEIRKRLAEKYGYNDR